MGNLTFIVPTKNSEDVYIDTIYELLSNKFPQYKINKSIEFNMLTIFENHSVIMDIYFDEDCYLVDFERDIEYLETEDRGLSDDEINILIKELKYLQRKNPKLEDCIQTSYGRNHEAKNDIDFFLRDYFGGYIFDEGIHPEFMGPSYVRKPKKKSFIEKLGNFLSNE